MDDENDGLVPQKQSLFPLSAEDIVDNALQSLDEQQAKEIFAYLEQIGDLGETFEG